MVYRLTLSYRGGAYAGWQRQPNALAVQEVLETALADLLGEEIRVVGASRTDAGVHALGQVAHFELGRRFPLRGLVHGVNGGLPEDIRVMAADRMEEGFHARKSSRAKEYRYRLIRDEVLSPLDSLFAVRVAAELDLEAMRLATLPLVGRHDFTAFALAGGAHRQPWRRILSAEWREEGKSLSLTLVGDGFLRGMVRSIVGTLLEVGRGRRRADEMEALLEGADRSQAGPTAPPQGLTLMRVLYPERWRVEGP